MGDISRAEAPSGVLERKELISKAHKVANAMNSLNLPVRSAFVTDNLRPDIRDSNQDYGSFKFWGSLEDGFRFTNLWGTTAILKDIKLPANLRGRGLGKRVVSKWEEAVLSQGIYDFAITNPRIESIEFWQKMGYTIPEEQRHRNPPYCMIKRR